MNEDTKLQCLRLAIDYCRGIGEGDIKSTAEKFYEWVTSGDKPSSLKIKYEKTFTRSDMPL